MGSGRAWQQIFVFRDGTTVDSSHNVVAYAQREICTNTKACHSTQIEHHEGMEFDFNFYLPSSCMIFSHL
jgi:hypothetical protein